MQVIFCTANGGTVEGDTPGTSPQPNGIKTSSGKNITYLYKVAEGLSLDSHAGKCAILCGLPSRVVQRAERVRYALNRVHVCAPSNIASSDLISQHELNQLLDEEMGDNERSELKAAEDICRRFLAWQLDERDGKSTKDKLAEILGRNSD